MSDAFFRYGAKAVRYLLEYVLVLGSLGLWVTVRGDTSAAREIVASRK